jgi:hypothetical protein
MPHSNNSSTNQSQLKTSELLNETINSLEGKNIEIGELILQFQRRSFGGVLLILAILAMVPGISIFAGMAMTVPAYQLLIGLSAPVFPSSIRKRKVGVNTLRRWGPKIINWVIVLEKLVRFRLPSLTNTLARRVMGLVIMLLAIIVTIPFPFSNFPPSVAIICFALGLLERDGLMIIIGSLVGVLAFIIGLTLFYVVMAWVWGFF